MKKEKLNQLREWVRRQAVNNVGSIEPEILQEQLQLDKKEFVQFIEYLIREGFIKNRYKFICDECGADCIEYEKNILKGRCRCGDCNKIFDLEQVKNLGHMVYAISYDELLEFDVDNMGEQEFESRIISLNEVKVGREEMETEKKKIFLGSSSEAKETMYDIAALIGSVEGFQTITWDSTRNGVFIAGDTTMESLIDIAGKVDGAVFIFSDDDEIWFRSEKGVKTTRDNVLFEYGLFIGKLDAKKVTFACKNKPRIATDLLGTNYLNADADESVLRSQIKDWLKRI